MCLVPMAGPGHYVLNCAFMVTFAANQDATMELQSELIFYQI